MKPKECEMFVSSFLSEDRFAVAWAGGLVKILADVHLYVF